MIGKNVTTIKNTQAKMEEFLDPSFYILFMSYQRKVGDQLFPELLVQNVFTVTMTAMLKVYKIIALSVLNSVPRNAADFMTFILLDLSILCLPCESYSYAKFHCMHSVLDSVFFRTQGKKI
jgi:hypothetical protein